MWKVRSAIAASVALMLSASLVAAIVLKSSAGAAVSCPTVAAGGAVSPEPVAHVDWDGCDLAGADLSHQQMRYAGLIGADLSDANLTGVVLDYANLSYANLTGATLQDVGANMTDFDHADLAGAQLETGESEGSDWAYANLTGAVLGSMYQDDLHGANLTNANASFQAQNLTASLSSDNLRGAVLAGTDLSHGDLSNSDLTGATGLDAAIVTNATNWTHTICPNATSADYYSDGCTSAVDVTTPSATPAVTTGTTGTNGWYTSPVTVSWHWVDVNALTGNCPASTPAPGQGAAIKVTASCTDSAGNTADASKTVAVDWTPPTQVFTGVKNGGIYAYPGPRLSGMNCVDVDALSGLARQTFPEAWAPTIPGSALDDVQDGYIKAECAGAADNAGNTAGAVWVHWTTTYLLGGFTSPLAGSLVKHTARTITVRPYFAKMLPAEAAARAKAREIRATLAGPGIKQPVTVTCSWNATAKKIQCTVPVPSTVKTARKYAITVFENLGNGWLKVPPAKPSQNPEAIYFK
jgi:uncharacterized protein YjbI with pentapeptide repeats